MGKTAEEADKLYRDFKSLEDAGAFAMESEVIPGPVMAEIAPRTKLICVSLGSGSGGDVTFLFMNDLCGETKNPPRHARTFGNLGAMHEALYRARVQALSDFRTAALGGEFPTPAETPGVDKGKAGSLPQCSWQALETNLCRGIPAITHTRKSQ